MASVDLPLAPAQTDILRHLASETEDSLEVLGRGMGLHRLLVAYLRLHCHSRCLVVVINATEHERDEYIAVLSRLEPGCPPKLVTSSTSATDRTALYMQGGEAAVIGESSPFRSLVCHVAYSCGRLDQQENSCGSYFWHCSLQCTPGSGHHN